MRKSTTGQSDKSKIIITPTLHPHCFTVFPHYCVWRSYQYSLKAQRGKNDVRMARRADGLANFNHHGVLWQRVAEKGEEWCYIAANLRCYGGISPRQLPKFTCYVPLACILTPEGREASLTLYEYGRIKQPLHELSGLWMAWGPWGAPAINTLCTTNIATLAAIISTWIALPHQNAINLYLSVF